MFELQPKFGKFPVIGLRTDYSVRPATELQVYRAARAKLTLSVMNSGLRRRLARAWFLFPAYLITEILVPWLRFSGPACTAFGHPRSRQFLEVARLSLNDGPCGRKGYYNGGLAVHRGGPELESYVHDQLHECLIQFCRFSVGRLFGRQSNLGNKQTLAGECKRAGLPHIATFARVAPDGTISFEVEGGRETLEHEASIFVKPAKGSQGRHADRWDRIGGAYTNSAGVRVEDLDLLLQHIHGQAMAIGGELLIQETLRNIPDIQDYGSRALSTVRLVTLRSADGVVRPVQAFMRIGTQPDAAVDNYHAEGVCFDVDYRTGTIGTGLALDFSLNPVALHTTPAAAGALTGSVVPSWRDLSALGVDAHRKLTLDTVCGWDIAVTNKGPVIVECNAVPSMDVPCQRWLGGFFGSEYSHLLRQEILTFLDRLEPEGSRFRFQHHQTGGREIDIGLDHTG